VRCGPGTRAGRRCGVRRAWPSWCRSWQPSPGPSSGIPGRPCSLCSAPSRCWAWRTSVGRRSQGHARTRAPPWSRLGWSCLGRLRPGVPGRRWSARWWWRSWCSSWAGSAATWPRRRPRSCSRSWWPCPSPPPPAQPGLAWPPGRWREASRWPSACCCGLGMRAHWCASVPGMPAMRWPRCWLIRDCRPFRIRRAPRSTRPARPTTGHHCGPPAPPDGTGP
jgi:hypothetical protein